MQEFKLEIAAIQLLCKVTNLTAVPQSHSAAAEFVVSPYLSDWVGGGGPPAGREM